MSVEGAARAATIKIMSAEEIAARAGGSPAPAIRLAETGTLFAERAMRLRQLAGGHAMADYLGFMADLALAQSQALQSLLARPDLPLPSPSAIAGARAVGMPPLPAVDWPRDQAWQAVLGQLVTQLRPQAAPAVAAVLDQLAAADAEWLDRQADALLTGVMRGLDLASAPLLAAALQVYFVALVARTSALHAQADTPVFVPGSDASLCPCCGSLPVASITRQLDGVGGQRYLHCSLCATEWHRPRAECSHCGGDHALAYEALQPVDAAEAAGLPAVQAETCGDCGHYLKILHGDRDPFVEPVADDLASLTLDLLVAETGLQRHGVNLMLLFGEAQESEGDDDAERCP